VGGTGGLVLIFQPIYLTRVAVYPEALPDNTNRVHYLPCKISALFWLVSMMLLFTLDL
jgi:hypothetical protein